MYLVIFKNFMINSQSTSSSCVSVFADIFLKILSSILIETFKAQSKVKNQKIALKYDNPISPYGFSLITWNI
jgi:hypothetical protein